ncbi:MAG: DUF58 domain-containing protein [Parvularculaceae bacterium]|nr:DUF58 domain-containing protein [Parvularculaceae bacterium]
MPPREPSEQSAALRREAGALADPLPPLLVEAQRIAQSVAAGLHGRRRAGPGESFWQHRPYAFGDAVSDIDWRQSARTTGRLYVRQNEWEAAATVWIWRDPSRSLDYSSGTTPSKRRRADVLATALALLLAQGGERIGHIGPSPRVFHGRSAGERLFQLLSEETFDDAASVPADAPIRPFSRVIYISDFLCDLDRLSEAAARSAALGADGVMLQVNDPAEETFPFAGRTEFEDTETPARLTFGDATRIADDYRRAFADHRASIRRLCDAIGWRFLAHRTDAPATNALMALYAALNPRGGL